MTRWSIALVLALCGCDQVFGLDRGEPPPIDAVEIDNPVDAAVSTVVALTVPTSVPVDEIATLTATVAGVPNTTVTCTFSVDRGSLAGNAVPVDLDENGAGTASVVFTAPPTTGAVMVNAMIGASTRSATLLVVLPVTVGYDPVSGGSQSAYEAGRLVGSRITLTAPFTLSRVGVWTLVAPASSMARLGIYDANMNLVAATDAVPITTGRNVYPLTTAQQLPAGTYWIVGAVSQAWSVESVSAVANEAYQSATMPFGPLPTVLPSGTQNGLRYSYFMLGSN